MDMEIKLGARTLTTPNDVSGRIALLLWGSAGCGKTTLAATSPGIKLWVLFDPDGSDSLRGRDDCIVLDLSGERNIIVEQFKNDDPLLLERMLKEHPEIETVVFDSVTSFSILCTENAISKVKSATVENPGLKGYGHRNALVLRACVSMMRLTKRLNKHIIIIAHEDSPTTDEEGHVLHISVALGGKMTNSLGMQLSEIWWMSDTGKERRIAVRPIRQRMPMKSRMFDVSTGEFTWRYNAISQEGDGIANWFKLWQTSNGKKVPLPK